MNKIEVALQEIALARQVLHKANDQFDIAGLEIFERLLKSNKYLSFGYSFNSPKTYSKLEGYRFNSVYLDGDKDDIICIEVEKNFYSDWINIPLSRLNDLEAWIEEQDLEYQEFLQSPKEQAERNEYERLRLKFEGK